MPNLLDIRRRIRSVKNTQQITQAMKMVSAAKLRRAQEQALQARPYARQLAELMAGLAPFLDASELGELGGLLDRREIRRRLVIVVTTDSGLVGAFNANVLKAVWALPGRPGSAGSTDTVYLAAGRKGRDALKRRGLTVAAEHVGLFARTIDHAIAKQIAAEAMRAYTAAEVDEVLLVGNQFKSVLQQVVSTTRLLPFEPPTAENAAEKAAAVRDYIFEAPPAQMLAELLPRTIESQVFRALLESLASEHAARMNAMEAATSNAGDLIDSLTLNMNRVRQAAITREIIEVVSGAAALD